MITLADRLQTTGEYYFSQKLREIQLLNRDGRNIINLGIGNPDLPPHQDVITTLINAVSTATVHGYQSYMGTDILRNAFALWYKQWYNVELNADEEILPLLGSKEGIMHVCMTYINSGDKVLIPNPGYPTYRSAVEICGGTCVEYHLTEENNWSIDFEALELLDLSCVKLMWVNYPHMPTGTLPTTEVFEKIIGIGKKYNILICHDNPYSFVLNEHPMSILAIPGSMDTAIELNSLSKSHNMAGWRVGVLCGNKKTISDVLRFKTNMDSGMFLPVQLAAAKALTVTTEWYNNLNANYRLRKEKVMELLNILQCQYTIHQAGLFMWAKISNTSKDGYELSDKLLYNAGVFITPGGIFGSNGNLYIRVSLCNNEDVLSAAIDRIKQKMK